MEPVALPDGFEPDEWWVVFHPTAASRWLGWLALGHFKHVSAFAYIQGFKVWLVYDIERAGTKLVILPADATGKAELVRYTAGCSILKMTRRPKAFRISSHLGFFCTTAIAHLIGLTGVARPDALWRLCLRNGGIVIDGRRPSTDPAIAGGPEPAGRAAAGAE